MGGARRPHLLHKCGAPRPLDGPQVPPAGVRSRGGRRPPPTPPRAEGVRDGGARAGRASV
eukprot:1196340-Prorocentrum_minimum.AAC.8